MGMGSGLILHSIEPGPKPFIRYVLNICLSVKSALPWKPISFLSVLASVISHRMDSHTSGEPFGPPFYIFSLDYALWQDLEVIRK